MSNNLRMNTDDIDTYVLNFIIIGNSNVGKSTVMIRFTEKNFVNLNDATIGVEYGSREIIIDDKKIKIVIWDTAGQERYRAVTRSYYRNTCCAILAYDITNRASFEAITDWLHDIKQLSNDPIIVLIGNKSDIIDKRVVNYEEGESLAKQYNMLFLETSAKSGEIINNLFIKAAEAVMMKIVNSQLKVNDSLSGVKYCNSKNKIVTKNTEFTLHDDDDSFLAICC